MNLGIYSVSERPFFIRTSYTLMRPNLVLLRFSASKCSYVTFYEILPVHGEKISSLFINLYNFDMLCKSYAFFCMLDATFGV